VDDPSVDRPSSQAKRRGESPPVEADAVERVYRSVQPGLLGFLRVLVGQAAEDVASQVWLEIASMAGRSPVDDDDLRRLAFVIARRRASDRRRRWWQRKVVLRPAGSAELDRPAVDADRVDDAAVRLLRLLPAAQAEVVCLRVLGGFGADEVAEMTGMSPGNVRVVQHRALESLRLHLQTTSGEKVKR
jgi:RNA polymerase sigma-70 factor (ECF subfamily)